MISVTDTPPNVAVGAVIEKLELAAAAAEAEKATKTTRLLPAPAVHVLVLVADTALTTVVPVPLYTFVQLPEIGVAGSVILLMVCGFVPVTPSASL